MTIAATPSHVDVFTRLPLQSAKVVVSPTLPLGGGARAATNLNPTTEP